MISKELAGDVVALSLVPGYLPSRTNGECGEPSLSATTGKNDPSFGNSEVGVGLDNPPSSS